MCPGTKLGGAFILFSHLVYASSAAVHVESEGGNVEYSTISEGQSWYHLPVNHILTSDKNNKNWSFDAPNISAMAAVMMRGGAKSQAV